MVETAIAAVALGVDVEPGVAVRADDAVEGPVDRGPEAEDGLIETADERIICARHGHVVDLGEHGILLITA
jgi:hypothetical protein